MTKSNQAEVLPLENPIQHSVALTPMDMLGRAVASGASIETLDKLMGLQERWEKNQARKAFDAAMSAAKAEIVPVIKNREVDFTSTKGRTNYRYEDLAGIARQIDPLLTKHGLSYRYKTSTENNVVTVTCIVAHRDGHSEENTLSAGRDESGNKNSIQAVGSTVTYLQRYTLKAALGLAASADDDGAAAFGSETLSSQEVDLLQVKIVEVGADISKFLTAFQIESVSDLPKGRLQEAITRLDNYKKIQAKKKGA